MDRSHGLESGWEAEDVAAEPDWDVGDIDPIEFRTPVVESDTGDAEW